MYIYISVMLKKRTPPTTTKTNFYSISGNHCIIRLYHDFKLIWETSFHLKKNQVKFLNLIYNTKC